MNGIIANFHYCITHAPEATALVIIFGLIVGALLAK